MEDGHALLRRQVERDGPRVEAGPALRDRAGVVVARPDGAGTGRTERWPRARRLPRLAHRADAWPQVLRGLEGRRPDLQRRQGVEIRRRLFVLLAVFLSSHDSPLADQEALLARQHLHDATQRQLAA